MADDETERHWADLREAERIWNAVRTARAIDRCPVIYQYRDKALLYTLSIDGRILLAWPRVDTSRLKRRLDLTSLEREGVVLPRVGRFGITSVRTPRELVPVWLDDTVDAVPLFAIRGTHGYGSAVLLADDIRKDVKANIGGHRRIGLTPPSNEPKRPGERRLASASGLALNLALARRPLATD